jgi:hypothetical protein
MSIKDKIMNITINSKPITFVILLAMTFGMVTATGMFDYGYQNAQARSSDDDDEDTSDEDSRSSSNDDYSSDEDSGVDQTQSSDTDSDSSTQDQPSNPVGKAVCNTALGLAGGAIGNAILPGVGGLFLGNVGSNLC